MKDKLKKPIMFTVILITLAYCLGAVLEMNTVSALSYQSMALTNATVSTDDLNIRQGPGVIYSSIGKVNEGDTLKVFGQYGTWYFCIEPKSGRVGAVSSSYVKVSKTAANTGTVTATPKPSTKTTQKPNPTAKPKSSENITISTEEQKMLDLINEERSKAGISPLSFDMSLIKVARLKAKDMTNNNYFGHQSPTYGSPFDMMKEYGISFKTAGENIAGNSSIENAVKAWMDSEGHKKNILNPGYNFTGIGIAESQKYGYVFVDDFISR